MGDAEAKKSRKARKGALTREINNLRRLMAEDSSEELTTRLPNLKDKFIEFEKAHEEYHKALTEDKDIDESDDYFLKAENDYIDSTMSLKNWLASLNEKKPTAVAKEDVESVKDLKAVDFMTMTNAPSLKIESFNGDPMKYHNFMAIFDEHVHKTRLSPSAKLARLLQCTTDKAKFAIQACAVLGEEGYEEARAILKKRFGNSFLIAEAVINSIKCGESVEAPADLLRFSDELLSCKATLSSMGKLKEIDTQGSIKDILKRLHPDIRDKWREKAMKHKRDKESYPDFDDFAKFVAIEAEDATDPVYGSESCASNTASKSSVVKSKASSSFSSNVCDERKTPSCCACSGPRHRLFLCESFKGLKPPERLQLVKQHELCENCFMDNHTTLQCRKPSFCSVPGCGMKHSKFVHVRNNSTDSNNTQQETARKLTSNQAEIVHTSSGDYDEVMLPVVKVCVNNNVETGALLDNGSTNSFCTERLVNKLGILGNAVTYKLSTLTSSQETKRSLVVDLNVMSSDGQSAMNLYNVYVVKDIPVHVPKFDRNMYSHFSDLPVHTCNDVDVLIGQCHAEALIPLETRKGQRDEPFAVRTMLGWSLNGRASSHGHASKKVVSNFVSTSTRDLDVQKTLDIKYGSPSEEFPFIQIPNNHESTTGSMKLIDKNMRENGSSQQERTEYDQPALGKSENSDASSQVVPIDDCVEDDDMFCYDADVKSVSVVNHSMFNNVAYRRDDFHPVNQNFQHLYRPDHQVAAQEPVKNEAINSTGFTCSDRWQPVRKEDNPAGLLCNGMTTGPLFQNFFNGEFEWMCCDSEKMFVTPLELQVLTLPATLGKSNHQPIQHFFDTGWILDGRPPPPK